MQTLLGQYVVGATISGPVLRRALQIVSQPECVNLAGLLLLTADAGQPVLLDAFGKFRSGVGTQLESRLTKFKWAANWAASGNLMGESIV